MKAFKYTYAVKDEETHNFSGPISFSVKGLDENECNGKAEDLAWGYYVAKWASYTLISKIPLPIESDNEKVDETGLLLHQLKRLLKNNL
jgi:hypothetical protein